MSDPSPTARTGDVPMSGNGTAPPAGKPRYCAYCGHEITAPTPSVERFGESFCSEDHAEEFASGVRAARVQAAAAGQAATIPDPAAAEQPAPAAPSGQWKMALKMAACCVLPMLALVVLAGGGGALLGAAGAALPLLAALACPLAMFFMMRAMMKGQHGDKRSPRDGDEQ
jgi:hypothetical protein